MIPLIDVKKICTVIDLALIREKHYEKYPDAPYNSTDIAIESYLNDLTFDEVKSLQVLMYLGRDEDYDSNLPPVDIYNSQCDYFDRSIGWNDKEIEIDQIVQKIPLGRYLINAKNILHL